MEQNVRYITHEEGHRTSVMLHIADYEKIMEDLHDLAAITERHDEPSIPHDKFLEELKKAGII